MSSDVATDTGPQGLHARLRNDPDRAMTGPRWRRRELDWRHAPDEFSAIHFHEDDVGDVGWDADITLAVPSDLPSGTYAMHLRADDGSEDRIPFFVRSPVGRPAADVAVLFSTMTYLAYANDHCMAWWMAGETTPPSSWDTRLHRPRFEGSPYFSKLDVTMREHPEIGASLYDRMRDGTGTTTVSTRRPLLNFRPDARSWFTGGPRGFPSDLGLVDWLEATGVSYDSLTDHDLHQHGADLLSPYRVLILPSHPEYWSQEMYDALDTFIEGGGRVMHLGGNTHYWVTSLLPERPWVMECRKTYDQDDSGGEPGAQPGPGYGVLPWERVHTTGEVGGMWDYRGRSPRGSVGVTSIAGQWQRKEPGYRRLPDSFDDRAAFIFEGVHETDLIGDFGLVQGGAAGDEIDGVDHGPGTPPNVLVLASSAGLHHEGGKAAPYWHRADMAYMEGPRGGAVFSVGSINWVSSLSWNGYDNNVSRITRNVLARFRDPTPIAPPNG
jgi:N,N-dimethylformamidase